MRLPKLEPRVRSLDTRIGSTQHGTPRITGRRLQAIRKHHFSKHPLCVECEKEGRVSAATELDHTIPLHLGGEEHERNRQGLCFDHHQAKTRLEAQRRAEGGAGQ